MATDVAVATPSRKGNEMNESERTRDGKSEDEGLAVNLVAIGAGSLQERAGTLS
jgi:hypothetical protein